MSYITTKAVAEYYDTLMTNNIKEKEMDKITIQGRVLMLKNIVTNKWYFKSLRTIKQ